MRPTRKGDAAGGERLRIGGSSRWSPAPGSGDGQNRGRERWEKHRRKRKKKFR